MRTSKSRRLGAAVIVLAPLSVVVADLGGLYYDPGPRGVAKFAAHPAQANVQLATDVVSCLTIPALALVALLVWRHTPRLATAAGMLMLTGSAGTGLVASFDVFTRVATDVPDPGAGALIDKAWDSDLFVGFTGTLSVLLVAGLVLLGIALWRTRIVPRWAAGAFLLYFPQLVVVEFVLPSQVAAVPDAILVAGFVACARLLLRDGLGLTAAALPSVRQPVPSGPPPMPPPAGPPPVVPAV